VKAASVLKGFLNKVRTGGAFDPEHTDNQPVVVVVVVVVMDAVWVPVGCRGHGHGCSQSVFTVKYLKGPPFYPLVCV